ncbi:MAG: hypothetical protein INR71_06955 [Terriglobus roseus]|nr:hypothetical protein [Terriglobus roseus]
MLGPSWATESPGIGLASTTAAALSGAFAAATASLSGALVATSSSAMAVV